MVDQGTEGLLSPFLRGKVLDVGCSTYADIGRAVKALGYCPTISMREGLERFLAWLRSAGDCAACG